MNIRPYAPEEFEPAVDLLRHALALPGLDASLIARDFLLAPGFRPEHLLVAETDGRLAGCLLAPRNDALAGPGRGFIAALAVAPELRRRGIATRLLRTALDAMREEGVTEVDVADVPVRYLLPGIDRLAYPGAYELLVGRFGFSVREEVASMGLALDRDFPVAPEIRPVAPGEVPLVRAFFETGWDIGWLEHLERSTLLKLLGDPTPSEILAWWENGQPLGLVHYRGKRFGPLTVGAAARGHGIGAALTLAGLAAMKAAGFRDAYFLVGRETVQPFYARLGFDVLRHFTKLTLRWIDPQARAR